MVLSHETRVRIPVAAQICTGSAIALNATGGTPVRLRLATYLPTRTDLVVVFNLYIQEIIIKEVRISPNLIDRFYYLCQIEAKGRGDGKTERRKR